LQALGDKRTYTALEGAAGKQGCGYVRWTFALQHVQALQVAWFRAAATAGSVRVHTLLYLAVCIGSLKCFKAGLYKSAEVPPQRFFVLHTCCSCHNRS